MNTERSNNDGTMVLSQDDLKERPLRLNGYVFEKSTTNKKKEKVLS